jgi:AcrR family transcriptional regulator
VTERRVVSQDRVVEAGVRHFLEHGTLDMEALAGELAVSRATLYRVAGSRDALLAGVLRSLTVIMLAKARAARTRDGVDGVLEVSRHFGEQLQTSTVVRRFLERDPEAAARVLINPSGPVHEAAVAIQRQIFADAGIEADMHLAYLYVRMVGTFFYAEYFTGRRADFDDLVPALRSLLPQP